MISVGDHFVRLLNSQTPPVHDAIWHPWHVVIPRRTITGRLAWGVVWRRRDGPRWIYKQYILHRGGYA
jgi:hypothetical protein